MSINEQSGASLAEAGHLPHTQGGMVLEGKFMDVAPFSPGASGRLPSVPSEKESQPDQMPSEATL